jgi:hypothetical protein
VSTIDAERVAIRQDASELVVVIGQLRAAEQELAT